MPDATPATSGSRACAPGTWVLVVHPGRRPELSAHPGSAELMSVEAPSGTAVVHGRFYGLDGYDDLSPAETVLTAHRERGENLLRGMGGFFSLVVHDPADDTLFCARDPLGIHPLFWVRTGDLVMVSPSVDTLLRQPEVPVRVHRAAVADHLRHRWPRPEETYFEGIRRVLPGHWLRLRGTSVTTARYWDPLFPGRDPEWIADEELGRFDELLEASIDRLGALGTPGIFLSGGLDSVSVGALAADRAHRHGDRLPFALSLAFPEPYNEAELQTRVAGRLGVPLLLAPLEEALQGEGIVRAAVLRGSVGAPIQNPWLPAYRWLAARGVANGCETVLTGSGGDEWLTVSPMYSADLLRSGRFLELAALGRSQARSFNVAPLQLARNLVWRFGLRPLVAHKRDALLRRWAPERLVEQQLRRAEGSLARRPWLAPDPDLRRELQERDEEAAAQPGDDDLLPSSGPREYFRECRKALTHPLVSMEAEEVFEYSRAAGVQVVHPYWDTRLVEFLHATPPASLNRGGRSKGLIRDMLARRFPDLGFERQRKAVTASYFGSAVLDQAPQVWRELRGARALADIGVVDLSAAAALYGTRSAGVAADHTVTDPMWEILTVEGWLRHHE